MTDDSENNDTGADGGGGLWDDEPADNGSNPTPDTSSEPEFDPASTNGDGGENATPSAGAGDENAPNSTPADAVKDSPSDHTRDGGVLHVDPSSDEEPDLSPNDDLVEMPRPRMDTSGWRQIIRSKRHHKKREKLIGDGYVEWWLVGDTVSRKFVKPERKGGGIPEKEIDGNTYLFPRSALVPNDDGMWTCIHREGEADPINISEPYRHSIPSDELKEYLDLRVASSAPGLLDGLGIGAGDLLKIGVAVIIGYAVIQNMGVL